MLAIYKDFKDKGVAFYVLYTREPHAGENRGEYDFRDKKQTKTHEERVKYALYTIKEHGEKRPFLIDTFGPNCVQQKLGGGMPNSLIVVDKEGKVALWQSWSNSKTLRAKLEEMTR